MHIFCLNPLKLLTETDRNLYCTNECPYIRDTLVILSSSDYLKLTVSICIGIRANIRRRLICADQFIYQNINYNEMHGKICWFSLRFIDKNKEKQGNTRITTNKKAGSICVRFLLLKFYCKKRGFS